MGRRGLDVGLLASVVERVDEMSDVDDLLARLLGDDDPEEPVVDVVAELQVIKDLLVERGIASQDDLDRRIAELSGPAGEEEGSDG